MDEFEGGDSACWLSKVCPECGGPHGPVRLSTAGLRGAVAYAGTIAVAAVTDLPGSGFGIDAEAAVDPRRDTAGLRGVLGPGSEPSVRDWVRVEAALKATGRGLRIDPATVVVSPDQDGSWTATVPGLPHPLLGWDLAGPPAVLLSAAILPGERSIGRLTGRAGRAAEPRHRSTG